MGASRPNERSYAFWLATVREPWAASAGSLIGGLMPGVSARALSLSLTGPEPYRYGLRLAVILFIPAIPVLWATQGDEPSIAQ